MFHAVLYFSEAIQLLWNRSIFFAERLNEILSDIKKIKKRKKKNSINIELRGKFQTKITCKIKSTKHIQLIVSNYHITYLVQAYYAFIQCRVVKNFQVLKMDICFNSFRKRVPFFVLGFQSIWIWSHIPIWNIHKATTK